MTGKGQEFMGFDSVWWSFLCSFLCFVLFIIFFSDIQSLMFSVQSFFLFLLQGARRREQAETGELELYLD